jgi:hypothetical protein
MTEEQKELLKEKLKQLLDEKLNLLTNKFQTDIDTVETLKYSYFDNVVLPFREIEEKNEKAEKELKEKKKDQKEHRERREDKDKRERLYEKLSKTPVRNKTSRDFGFKVKAEVQPTRSRIFEAKKATRNDNSTLLKERMKKKTITTVDVSKRTARSKTPIRNREKKTDDERNTSSKTRNVKVSAVKTNTTKKAPPRAKPSDKKEKKEKKKVEEEKKKVIMKDKSIIKIPEELKDSNDLLSIYFVLRGKYLDNKEKFKISLCNPTICNIFIKDIFDEKKKELQTEINKLEESLNQYEEIETYLTTEFSPSKTSQNSLMFVKKDEIENLIKKGSIPIEINKLFKILLYIFDIEFDETLENEDLLNYFISEVMDKNQVKDLKAFAIKYLSDYKDLNISKEKVEKINDIINSDERVIASNEISKISRNISYSTLLIKECYDYLNLKTLDNVPYYELKAKNKLLQEYKDKLSKLEKNGVQLYTKENPKEEIDENNIKNNLENNIENQKVEESIVAKESDE